jgi:phosphoglycerate dehydrogenase-like enzyme
MNDLLRNSDFLTIHAGLNQDSFKILGKDEFCKMKKDAYLINTARGGIVNENDLVEALQKTRIRGAALDTFSHEPITKSNKLLRLTNLIVLPHIGSATINTRTKMSRIAAQNLIYVLEGSGPVCSINTEDGSR